MKKFIQNNEKSSQSFQAEKIIINSKKQNKNKSLPGIINSHPVIVYCGIAIVAFGLGFGTKTGIENTMNQELVIKNTYTLNKDIEKEYISISKYTALEAENKQLKNELNVANSHDEWMKRYDKLVQERAGFENQLNNLNNLSTGIKNNSEDSYKVKRDELIRKIQSRDEQIKVLLEKI